MLNNTSFLILNGRFEAANNPIPYTLQRQDEATINDYNLIAKQHFPKVKTCYVIPRPSRTLRSKSGPPTDHNPIILHLSLLAKSTTQSRVTANIPIAQEFLPRTQFHSSKLKDPAVREKFPHAPEDQADKAEQAVQTLKNSLHQGSINATQYAEKANAIIVPALQVTAQKIIGTTEFRGKNAQREHLTKRRQQDNGHFSADDKRIVAKQTLTQTLKDKLRQAREEGAPAHVIADLGKSHTKEKHDLLKLQHQMWQKIVTDAVASSASVPTHPKTSSHSMWDLLRRYKTDHVQSTLPAHTHDNASPDPRIWKLGPLTLDPQAWHRFRYALGHHLLRHKASPYNEEAAHCKN